MTQTASLTSHSQRRTFSTHGALQDRGNKEILLIHLLKVITCCRCLRGLCSECFWSHRAAGRVEPGEFYGHDLEKQLNRELKMEERLRHTQEQDKNVLVRQLNIRRPAKTFL